MNGKNPGSRNSKQSGWLKTTAEVAGILSLVVAVIAILVQLSDSSTDQNPPTPDSRFEMFDSFSGSQIDPNKWAVNMRGSNNNVVPYAQGGKLHFVVTQDTPKDNEGENHAFLQAKLQPQRPITAVSFDMTLESTEGTGEGGVYARVFADKNREHRVAVKSESNSTSEYNGPHLDYYICKQVCDNNISGTFEHPSKPSIQIGQTYSVHIYQDNSRWVFQVDNPHNFPPIYASNENGPIENLGFSLYSFGGHFHITVDNVQVAYA